MPTRVVVTVIATKNGMKVRMPNGSLTKEMSMPPDIREVLGDSTSMSFNAILTETGSLTIMSQSEEG